MNNPSDIENQLIPSSPFDSRLMNQMKKINCLIIFLLILLVLVLNYLYISLGFDSLATNEGFYVTCSPIVLSCYILGYVSYMIFSFLCLYSFYRHHLKHELIDNRSSSRSQWQSKFMIFVGLLEVIFTLLTIILFNYLCYDGEKSKTYNLLFYFMFQPLFLGLYHLCLRKRNQDQDSSHVTI
jgi:hypothetical protein